METPISFKVIIVGDSGVGKTSLQKRLVQNIFMNATQTTIGVDFDTTIVDVDGQQVKLQIWDTAGQERFRTIAKAYFRNAVGVLLVFDLSERKSFENANMWLNDIRSLCDPGAVIMLVGNKADLVEKRVVAMKEAEEFAQRQDLTYLETSAMDGTNVREAFVRVATKIYRKGGRTVVSNGFASNTSGSRNCC